VKILIYFLLTAAAMAQTGSVNAVLYSTTPSASAYPAMVPVTGQTNSYATGDDGDLEQGVAWPSPRFTIQANTNCVKDNLTGLIWARNADLFGVTNLGAAITNCMTLDYGGHTDWRLPNISEILSLTISPYYDPSIVNAAGTGQATEGDPFNNYPVGAVAYWSSTTCSWAPTYAYCGMSHYVTTVNKLKSDTAYTWPVRGP
jgi:hypothetical protein